MVDTRSNIGTVCHQTGSATRPTAAFHWPPPSSSCAGETDDENHNRNSLDDIYENSENFPSSSFRGRAVTISDPSNWRRRNNGFLPRPAAPGYLRLRTSAAAAAAAGRATGGGPCYSIPWSPRIVSQPMSPLLDHHVMDFYHHPPVMVAKRIHQHIGEQEQQQIQPPPKHAIKYKLNRLRRLFDEAFGGRASEAPASSSEELLAQGADMVAEIMENAKKSASSKTGGQQNVASLLCDYVRESGYLDKILNFFLLDERNAAEWCTSTSCARILEACLDATNCRYIISALDEEKLRRLISLVIKPDHVTTAISILDKFFQDGPTMCSRLVEWSALDFLLSICSTSNKAASSSGTKTDTTVTNNTLRSVSRALANLCLNSDHHGECQQKIIDKNTADWLFLLASSPDRPTRYYACLAVCALAVNKEIEAAVIKSGTLALVEPFLLQVGGQYQPDNDNDDTDADFSALVADDLTATAADPANGEWLRAAESVVPMLRAKRSEPRAIAAFYMAFEARRARKNSQQQQAGKKQKKDLLLDEQLLEVFEQIGAVEALKEVASLPEEIAPKLARLALELIGVQEVPYKLSRQVALWSVQDVQRWVRKIGYDEHEYARAFEQHQVDGDLLLLITEKELERDIGMKSGLVRRRFMRELENVKISADYTCLDGGKMDRFLASIDPRFSIYTYKLLDLGLDCSNLASVTEEILQSEFGIMNPVHRKKLAQSFQGCKDMDDVEMALLSRQIDVFICYRRSTGSQLASLIKVLLQLRGYKVFIDVDRLYAGKFDSSLLKNIQAAKHFVLVLTPQALDRCCLHDDDDDQHGCTDWVHKEISCAIEHNKNIIPVLDPEFQWPTDEEHRLPQNMRVITKFNGVRWVHEYQDACMDKLVKFITGEINVHVLTPPQLQQQQNITNSVFDWLPSSRGSYDQHRNTINTDIRNWTPRSRSNTMNAFNAQKSPLLSPGIGGPPTKYYC